VTPHDHLTADLRASCALADAANDNTLTRQALVSLSHTQRRLAHQAKAEALKWESAGNALNYRNMRQESDRLWRDAKYHLAWARRLAR
jgi:hypothetical protein